MTIFQVYRTFLFVVLDITGDQNEARAGARLLTDELAQAKHAHLTQPDQVLPASQQARFETALAALKAHRPLAYILGWREFYKLNFRCDERALIPRPETELLVEFALRQVADLMADLMPESPRWKIADLGTGSGCVAIAIAKNCAAAHVVASDVSPAALSLARENAALHTVAERVRFVAGTPGDWAAPLREYSRGAAGRFDLLVSNPPYIAPRDIENLPPQIKNFEPRTALNGGEDGLECYRQLAAQCGALLKPHGFLACELGAGQFQRARKIFEERCWRVHEPLRDFAGIERVLVAQRHS